MKKELFGDDSLNLEVETEAVHTWHITGWKAMDRRSHGPIFECGGSPWYKISSGDVVLYF